MNDYIYEDINIVLQKIPNEQNKGCLYIGNISAAEEVKNKNPYNIGAVLTVAEYTNLEYDEKKIIQKIINADDIQSYQLRPSFEECIEFIDKHISKTNVLVHCLAGVSRSATIVIAYLMNKNKWDLQKSFQFLKQKRNFIQPNDGFIRQLKEYEIFLKIN